MLPPLGTVLGPEHFFFFNLFASARTGAPLSWRNRSAGTIDQYATAAARWLVTRDGFDFLLFYLSDYDYASHAAGPDRAHDVLTRCDSAIGELVSAAGGLERFLERYAVIIAADHGQTPVAEVERIVDVFAHSPATLVASSNRAAGIYRLDATAPSARQLAEQLDGNRVGRRLPLLEGGEAVARRDGEELRLTAGRSRSGDPAILDHPDGVERAWAALHCPNAGEVLVSAAEGWEFADLGGKHHRGGGSHGSLLAGDSEVPMLAIGLAEPHDGSSTSRPRSSPILVSRPPRTVTSITVDDPAVMTAEDARGRVGLALRRRANWEQLIKFCVVGATGYAVNLAVYKLLLGSAGLHYATAAVGSFVVAVTNNYIWNRLWTFRSNRGGVVVQGARFFAVSALALTANLAVLAVLVDLVGLGEVPAQAIAIIARHPRELRRQQAVVVPAPLTRRAVPFICAALVLAVGGSGPQRRRPTTADSRAQDRGPGHAARAGQSEDLRLARPLPAVADNGSGVRRQGPDLDVKVWSGEAGRSPWRGRGSHRRRPQCMDRAAGRVEDGPRATRRLRRPDAHVLARLARLLARCSSSGLPISAV